MKTALATVLTVLTVVALAAVTAATGSPGGLDGRGGHHCWTNCAARGYYKGQYHCHRSPCSRLDVRRHRAHGH